MVDAYQTGEPVPDGFLTIQLINPLNPWIDYLEPNVLPDDLESDFNIQISFKDILAHAEDPIGIVIKYDDHRDIFPWSNIHNCTIQYNSDAYQEAINNFRLEHEHEWIPQIDDEGKLNFKWCAGCKVTDYALESLKQKQIDMQRGLK